MGRHRLGREEPHEPHQAPTTPDRDGLPDLLGRGIPSPGAGRRLAAVAGPAARRELRRDRLAAPFDANTPKVLWKAKVGAGYSSVAVAAGRLYTLGNAGDVNTVFCLNAQTGAVVWKHSYACSATAPQTLVRLYAGTRSTPTVAGGKVYVFSRDGQLLCLSAGDGKPAWTVDVKAKPLGLSIPTWGFACSPLVAGGRVLCWTPGRWRLSIRAPANSCGKASPTGPATPRRSSRRCRTATIRWSASAA